MGYYVKPGEAIITTVRGIVAWDSEDSEITPRCLGYDLTSEDGKAKAEEHLKALETSGLVVKADKRPTGGTGSPVPADSAPEQRSGRRRRAKGSPRAAGEDS